MPARYERLGPEVALNFGGKTAIAIFIFMLLGFVVESELAQVSPFGMLCVYRTDILGSMYSQL